jgi:hypothetical protein
VFIELRSAAASRFDRFAVANPSYTVAVVSGSIVITAPPLNSPPFYGNFSISDPSWTRADAQRVADALGGRDITHDPGFHPAVTIPHR